MGTEEYFVSINVVPKDGNSESFVTAPLYVYKDDPFWKRLESLVKAYGKPEWNLGLAFWALAKSDHQHSRGR